MTKDKTITTFLATFRHQLARPLGMPDWLRGRRWMPFYSSLRIWNKGRGCILLEPIGETLWAATVGVVEPRDPTGEHYPVSPKAAALSVACKPFDRTPLPWTARTLLAPPTDLLAFAPPLARWAAMLEASARLHGIENVLSMPPIPLRAVHPGHPFEPIAGPSSDSRRLLCECRVVAPAAACDDPATWQDIQAVVAKSAR